MVTPAWLVLIVRIRRTLLEPSMLGTFALCCRLWDPSQVIYAAFMFLTSALRLSRPSDCFGAVQFEAEQPDLGGEQTLVGANLEIAPQPRYAGTMMPADVLTVKG